jgi:natural product precursor
MKKLSKINLKDAEILSDKQMKTVFGGDDEFSSSVNDGSSDLFDGSTFACKDSSGGNGCTYVYQGHIFTGHCVWIYGQYHCSDLN